MKLNDFYKKLITLPKDVQKIASRAMFYASFAMQSTEKQVFGEHSGGGSDTGTAEMLGAHTLLGQLKGGVHTNQTKELEEKYMRIMDNAPLVQIKYKPILNKKGEVVGVEAVALRGEEFTKKGLADKLLSEWEDKTDKTDNFPIEYGLKVQRVLVNEEDLVENPKAKKEFVSNLYIDYATLNTGHDDDFIYDYLLEEVCDAVQVKTLDTNTKLIELYTNLSKYAEAYYYFQGDELISKLSKDLTHITLIQKNHKNNEIFLYKVENMRDIKNVGGKLLFKFEATLVIASI